MLWCLDNGNERLLPLGGQQAAWVDHRTYISAIERGIANPSVETLANICYSLNVTLAELFAPLDGVSLKPTGTRRTNAATPPEIKRQRLR